MTTEQFLRRFTFDVLKTCKARGITKSDVIELQEVCSEVASNLNLETNGQWNELWNLYISEQYSKTFMEIVKQL